VKRKVFAEKLAISYLLARRVDGIFANSEISVQVDDSLDLVVVINQPDMAADSNVAMVAWRRRQAARQIGRSGVHLPAQVLIQHRALMQARFFVGRQPVLVPETCGGMGLILVVPVVRDLLVVFVKMGLVLAVLIASLPAVLCKSSTASQDENSNYSRTKQPICIHE
jgi:hypothetical protein